MVSYKVELTHSAEKDLFSFDKTTLGRIWLRIKSLALTPFPKGSLKLSGSENTYRIRVGRYRVVYTVADETIMVIGIKHRKDAYR